MLNVFLTVDTEVWQDYDDLGTNIRSALYGVTPQGEFGLRFLVDRLNAYGLKAGFFIEPLFSYVTGKAPLSKAVSIIQDAGQDVQLHIHTEWLSRMSQPILKDTFGISIKDFSLKNQIILISHALERLRSCGAENINAFRAGNYGANLDTLRALAENGILYDTSHNTCYLDGQCDMKTPSLLLQPRKINGVYEFPVSFFVDFPGHFRHLQLTACSFREIRNALIQAWKQRWFSLVIVLHSFELLHRRKPGAECLPGPDRILIRRFEKMCRFLSENSDKFRTAVFSDLSVNDIRMTPVSRCLESNVAYTAGRYPEQILRRFQR